MIWSVQDSILLPSLARDRRGGSDPTPIDFSWITSVALQASTRNVIYLLLHQLYVPTQNFGRLILFWVILIRVTQCHASLGEKLLNAWKITKNKYFNLISNKKHQTTQNNNFFKISISDFPRVEVNHKILSMLWEGLVEGFRTPHRGARYNHWFSR